MSLGILVRSLVKESSVRWNYGLNLWGRLGSRSFSVAHSVAQKADSTAQKNFESTNNKPEQTQMVSREKFKKLPSKKEIGRNDIEKTSKAYNNNFVCKKNKSDLKQFKQKQVESFEKFKEFPSTKKICGNDPEKILRAYKGYRKIMLNHYKQSEYGGNPATMV